MSGAPLVSGAPLAIVLLSAFSLLIRFLCAFSGINADDRVGKPVSPLGMIPPAMIKLINLLGYDMAVLSTVYLTKICNCSGVEMGVPSDSLPSPASLTREDANDILDEEDMDSADDYGDCADASAQDRAAGKRSSTDCSTDADASAPGPSLPPIYYSIL